MKKDIEYNKKCGLRLKECRKALNMTQEKLADKVHLCTQHISNFETGKRPLTPRANDLALVLKVRSDYLLCQSDYKTILDEFAAEVDEIHNVDSILISLLRQKGYSIYFESKDNKLSTDIRLFCNQDCFKVYVNGEAMDLLAFRFLLDDIEKQLDFHIKNAERYQERYILTSAVEYQKILEQ